MEHGAAVKSDGSLVTWGSDDENQLGRTTPAYKKFHPPGRVAQLATHFVTQVACTFYGVLALTNKGDLFSWGRDQQGELGQRGRVGDFDMDPARIEGLPPVQQISAEYTTAGAVTVDGDVYMWGSQPYAGDRESDSSMPMMMNGDLPKNKFKHICCGGSVTGAVTDERLVDVWSARSPRTAKLVECLKFVKIGSICLDSNNDLIAFSDDKLRIFLW